MVPILLLEPGRSPRTPAAGSTCNTTRIFSEIQLDRDRSSTRSMVSAALPFIGVIVAVLSFGSYSLPLKGEAVQAAQLHPVIFQLYVSLGVALSSLLLLIAAPEAATSNGFPPEGMASAFIWNLGNTASSGAVIFSGLAVAQGLWAPLGPH